MKYVLRMAQKCDLDGLCQIRNNKDLFNKYLLLHEHKEIYLVIAEESNVILGFGLLKLTGSLLPKLSDLYVKENYRGNGIGSDLIRYLEKFAKELGFAELFVSVDLIENPKMIKLIKRHGYEPITEAYSKTATYYDDNGAPFEKTYTRIDLKNR